MSVEIDTTEESGATIVSLTGELDLPGADRVSRELARLEKENPPVLILDLGDLGFLDSSGLHLIVSANARAKQDGRRLAVVRGPEAVDRMFRVTMVEDSLEMLEEPSELR